MPNPREIALEALENSLKRRSFLTISSDISGSDAAFINMLCLTAVRHLTFIQLILGRYIKKKLPEKAEPAHYALVLAITEILYLNTPDYAAINSYVEIVKKTCDNFIAGMVNAVLRKICQDKEALLQEASPFFPASFLSILKQDYTPDILSKIEQAATNEPPLAISVKSNPQDWAEKLGGTYLANNTISLSDAGRIPLLSGYQDGEWWVQDFAASLAVTALGEIKGLKIFDLCAAPGGKTSQLLNSGAIVTSLDNSAERLELLKSNLTRLHFPFPEIITADALDYLENYSGEAFDAIVLDAPCSATGIFRRHPELVHFKDKKDIHRQVEVQKSLLNAASKALKVGGTLIYAVCSISKSEGEVQIRRFLEQNDNFQIIPLSEKDINLHQDGKLQELITKDGFIRTLPFMLDSFGGVDSFFIAKIKKVK